VCLKVGSASTFHRYDHFAVDDFAFKPSTMDRLVFGSTTLLGLLYRPHTATTIWLRVSYLW
jgi:hypothetical protein